MIEFNFYLLIVQNNDYHNMQPVGSGKSTIINAIIGEVSVSSGTTLETRGRVAYASQVAFIINATLRENILFGSPFDAHRYNQVLDACCLRADIDQLGLAGDLTEIGERGVTLSGGRFRSGSVSFFGETTIT